MTEKTEKIAIILIRGLIGVKKNIKDTLTMLNLHRKHFCKILDTYIKYMWADDYSDQLEKFWHYTKTLDHSRKENLKDVSPKTWELLHGDRYG